MFDYQKLKASYANYEDLKDDEIIEKADRAVKLIESNDPAEQEEAILLHWKLWVSGRNVKAYTNDDMKKQLALIAGGKYENVTADNVQLATFILFECLQNYVLQLISENAPSYVIGVDAEERRTNRETMVADCYVQFVKDLPKYDPDKSSPLTYFSRSFTHAISEFKNSHRLRNLKPSVSNDVRRVANAAAIVRNRGGDEDDVVQLADELKGMSYERIFMTLGIKKSLEKYQNLEDVEEMSSAREEWSPEIAAMNHELLEKLFAAIHELKNPEREIFCMMEGVDLDTDSVCLPAMSVADISNVTGLKKNDIEAISYRAKTYIQQRLVPYMTGSRCKKDEALRYAQKKEIVGKRIDFAGRDDDDVEEAMREIVEINVNLSLSPDDILEPPVDY